MVNIITIIVTNVAEAPEQFSDRNSNGNDCAKRQSSSFHDPNQRECLVLDIVRDWPNGMPTASHWSSLSSFRAATVSTRKRSNADDAAYPRIAFEKANHSYRNRIRGCISLRRETHWAAEHILCFAGVERNSITEGRLDDTSDRVYPEMLFSSDVSSAWDNIRSTRNGKSFDENLVEKSTWIIESNGTEDKEKGKI